jgi:undecaprenyl pyrophosphate phosphatase UppP
MNSTDHLICAIIQTVCAIVCGALAPMLAAAGLPWACILAVALCALAVASAAQEWNTHKTKKAEENERKWKP